MGFWRLLSLGYAQISVSLILCPPFYPWGIGSYSLLSRTWLSIPVPALLTASRCTSPEPPKISFLILRWFSNRCRALKENTTIFLSFFLRDMRTGFRMNIPRRMVFVVKWYTKNSSIFHYCYLELNWLVSMVGSDASHWTLHGTRKRSEGGFRNLVRWETKVKN